MLLISTMLLLGQGQSEQWVRRGEYEPNNPYTGLEITAAQASYVPFKHNPAKPNDCLSSTVTFTFTIQNKGKKAQRLPKYLSFVCNSPKPFWRNTVPLDLIANPEKDVAFGEDIMFRGAERVTLKPGQTHIVTSERTPPGGPWNPMNVSARFGEDLAGDIYWVGLERPFNTSLTVNAPDYQPARALWKAADGKPELESRLWTYAVYFEVKGSHVGGPIEKSIKVYEKGKKSRAALMAGHSDEASDQVGNHPFGQFMFVGDKKAVTGPLDFDRVEGSIKVGCPKHGFQQRLIDANPSNDTRMMQRG